MQPAFRVSKLDSYWPWLDTALERVLASWGNSGVCDVYNEMTDLCFEILAVPLFGEDMSEVRPLVIEAAAALHDFHQSFSRGVALGGLAITAMRAAATFLGRPDFFFDPSLLPTKYAKRLRLAIAELDRFVYHFIDRRASGPPRDDLMYTLIAKVADGSRLDRQQIRDEIVTMFFAGHETGAASISWALYLLAKHPDVAARLAAEPQGGPFAHQVLHESLRLYPPAYRVSRTVVQTCELGSMTVPAGAELVIPQWAVHRSPRYFDEPNAISPGTLDAGTHEDAAQVRVFSLWWGPADLHRESFRLAGRRAHRVRNYSALQVAPCQGQPGGPRPRHYATASPGLSLDGISSPRRCSIPLAYRVHSRRRRAVLQMKSSRIVSRIAIDK